MAVYVESLQPFHPWELEAGVKLALESHKYAKWPKPAEVRDYCMSARLDSQQKSRPAKPTNLPQYMLNKPARREITPEERELVNMKITIRQEWEANGKYMAKSPDGSWMYTVSDLTKEARDRLLGPADMTRAERN